MRKPILIITLLVGVILFLSLVKLFVVNSIATNGITLARIQNETKALQTENTVLSEKLLSFASLTNIASRAAEMGFTEDKSHIYLDAPQHLASNQ